jgi:redox-sensing transcriptional repressor
MGKQTISTQTLRRLPIYLSCLRGWEGPRVSAATVAGALRLSEIQVRKDLAAVSDGGRPGVGYETEALIGDIERYLGYDGVLKAVLVGAGNLGMALLGYAGFESCGLRIVAAFDAETVLLGRTVAGRGVYPMAALPGICRAEGAKLGIITVPEAAAQDALDRLVESGIRAVWNFAPARLRVPEGIVIQNENLVASLTVLTRRLSESLEKGQTTE